MCKQLGISGQIRIEETLQTGRSDARVGAIVYEFKKPYRLDDKATRREATEKTFSYLRDYAAKRLDPNKLRGFITDGKLAGIIGYNPATKQPITVDPFERPVELDQAFIPLNQTAVWLERMLRTLASRELSPENLLEDFGPGASLCRTLVR